MDKKLGKYADDRKDFVRPKQDVLGTPLRDGSALHNTRNIGNGLFVVVPVFADKQEVETAIAELQGKWKPKHKGNKVKEIE